MRHLTDGALRRLYDEPHALDEETRSHYRDCAECQGRFAAVADDARHAMALLAVPAATVDPAAALDRVKDRARPARRSAMVVRGWRRPALGGLAAAVLAVGLAATMAFTPLGSNLIGIFQPTQVSPVTITTGDLSGLDAFSTWGDVRWTKQPELQQTETAAEAARVSNLPAIQVSANRLPSALAGAPVTYAAVSASTGTVTFTGSAPRKVQGSTLTVVIGPAETAVYGDLGRLAQQAQADGSGAGSAQQGQQAVRNAIASAGPILFVAEMRSPQVSSTGASVADIKSALLAQPGLSPNVRTAIEEIDSPTGNLPLPVPAGLANAHAVQVQGVNGTAVGDNTGLGSAIVWIKHGRVYGVAGTLTEDQLLAVANGLT